MRRTDGPRHGGRSLRHLGLLLLAILVGGSTGGDGFINLALQQPLPALSELVIQGVNPTGEPRIVVVRVDDRPNAEYSDRANEERLVPPGPFTLRLRLAGLRTPRGRSLDLAAVSRAWAFGAEPGITVASPRIAQPPALPPGTHGWFFGPAHAAPLSGFQAVDPTDPAVSGPAVRAVRRPNQDPILAWGTRLTRFEARLPPGRWRLTLWTEDPGEWETLPSVLERRIRINGADVLLERRTEAEWVRSRYLAGRDIEADPAVPPYLALAAHRGGRVTADVSLPDGTLVLELAGHPAAATHISALTASPAGATDPAADALEAERARRFQEAWPVIGGLSVAPGPNDRVSIEGISEATTAPGGIAIFHLTARAPTPTTARLSVEGMDGARALWGMWRWRRPAPETPGLALSAAHLRGDAMVPLRPDRPRPLVVVVPVPPGTQPGVHVLRLHLDTPDGRIVQTLRLDILPVQRPEPRARVGVFLDFAPHLASEPALARRQATCDLDTIRSLGLTAVAPALSTPGPDMAPFLADLREAAARFAPPFVAYAPARRLERELGGADAAAMLAQADAAAREAGLPPPIWTVADEPTMAGTLDHAAELASRMRLANRDTRLAAHVNDPGDRRILRDSALVTVNARFGADAVDIAAIRDPGRAVWLYNMPRLRLGAGFYLWRSGADGLLQWHARMPTADPFDPTDGREGDVQFLWPMAEICAPADLDADLLDLAQGMEDLRWIAWLEAQAEVGAPEAVVLKNALWSEVPGLWKTVASRPETAAPDWRERIARLARILMR